jgi:UPF0271 protein
VIPRLDLNADLGEHDGPPPAAALALLRVVTSANIACGGHAGDEASMRHTAIEAARLGVQIGAHPSYPDRAGFGRRVLPMSLHEVAETVGRQVEALSAVARAAGAPVRHVKPHGALYNLACRDRAAADAITVAIVGVDRGLALYAPHGSALADAGVAAGLRVVSEGFLDRAYEEDGTLTPREVPGAVLHDPDAACIRAVEWVQHRRVRTRTGVLLSLPLDTLCVHGDTPDAVAIATRVREALLSAGVQVRPSLQVGD